MSCAKRRLQLRLGGSARDLEWKTESHTFDAVFCLEVTDENIEVSETAAKLRRIATRIGGTLFQRQALIACAGGVW